MAIARGRRFVMRCRSLLPFVCLFLEVTTWCEATLENVAKFKLEPTKEYIEGGTYAIWQIPASPVGILFIAHGKSKPPDIFWDFGPDALGSVEERLITKAALARGYAVVTVACPRSSGWNLSIDLDSNVDFLVVTGFLRYWRVQHDLEDLPLTALGCSRGGDFVTVLALGERMEGIVIMIAQGLEEALQVASKGGGSWPYPPVLFLTMVRDTSTATVVQRHKSLLSSKGLVAKVIELHPLPVHKGYFAERIPKLRSKTSLRLVKAMRAKGYLTSDFYVHLPTPLSWANYGQYDWPALVESLGVLPRLDNGTLRWAGDVEDEIKLAYGFHMCSSLPSVEMMDWCGRGQTLFDDH